MDKLQPSWISSDMENLMENFFLRNWYFYAVNHLKNISFFLKQLKEKWKQCEEHFVLNIGCIFDIYDFARNVMWWWKITSLILCKNSKIKI